VYRYTGELCANNQGTSGQTLGGGGGPDRRGVCRVHGAGELNEQRPPRSKTFIQTFHSDPRVSSQAPAPSCDVTYLYGPCMRRFQMLRCHSSIDFLAGPATRPYINSTQAGAAVCLSLHPLTLELGRKESGWARWEDVSSV